MIPVTRRQEIMIRLSEHEWELEDLRRDLAVTVSVLEEDLRHIARSARATGSRLRVRPACCVDCSFELSDRGTQHLHRPGRCPRCKGRRLNGPWLRIS